MACGCPGHADFCPTCRKKYDEESKEDMTHCLQCAEWVPSKSAYCYSCWRALPPEEKQERVILKTLYKKNGDKVQKWSIEVEGNKFRTIEGFVDGAMTTSEWTVCVGKNVGRSNETSPEQQAIKEAQAKNRLKQDKGYKEDIDCIHEAVAFEPMLAHSYSDYKEKVTFPCFVQPKLDGMRCPIRKEGAFSRQGKPVNSVPHIVEALKPIFDAHPGLVIDGELYNHDLKHDFNKLISVVKKSKPTAADIAESKKTMQFHVYDMFDISNGAAKFRDRYMELLELVDGVEFIVPVKTFKVDNQAEMDELYEKFLEEGYEGMMVRNDYPYVQKRTANLLKRKEFVDGEYMITDIIEGIGNRSGMMGKIIMITPQGESFEADGSGLGGHEAYVEMLENKEDYIGKMATVKYQNLTPDRQVPRFGKVVAIRDYE